MSMKEIVDRSDLDKSSVQRLLNTLTKLGYIIKNEETKRYFLSVKNVDLAYGFIRSNSLISLVTPYLVHLNIETEESVNLSILDDLDVVVISRIASRHLLNTNVIFGTRVPAYCSASGIAILSKIPREEALDILERSDRRQITSSTTWRMDDLIRKLDVSAEAGYALNFEEMTPGALSLASPIVTRSGIQRGAINLAVSRSRYTPEEMEKRFGQLIRAASLAVSSEIDSQHN